MNFNFKDEEIVLIYRGLNQRQMILLQWCADCARIADLDLEYSGTWNYRGREFNVERFKILELMDRIKKEAPHVEGLKFRG